MQTRGFFFLAALIAFFISLPASAAPKLVAAGEALIGIRPGRTSAAKPFAVLAASADDSTQVLGPDILLVRDHEIASSGQSEVIDYDPATDPCPKLLGAIPAARRGDYFCEPNYILRASLIPDDPHYNRYQSGFFEAIHAPEAWSITTGCSGVKVAVIDTGIDYTHSDLTGNIDPDPGYDFINNDSDPMDDNSHGTFCAGVIGAVGNNARGTAGVNWTADIIGLKFLSSRGGGKTSDAIRAIDYGIERGVKIMSSSWGGPGDSEGLRNAIERARDAGILFVAAAGNNASNSDLEPNYPAAYPTENILSVAASEIDGTLAWFSNYGAVTVDLSAPGVEILSTVPGGYTWMSGTSMATPLVAGAAALALCRNPDLNYAQLKALLMNTVTPVSDLAGKTISGGMLNIQGAIENAMNPPEIPLSPAPISGSLNVYDRETSSSVLRPGRRFEIHYQLSAPLSAGTGIFIKFDRRTCPGRRRIWRTSASVSLRGRLAATIPATYITMILKSAADGKTIASVKNRIKNLRRSGRTITRAPVTTSAVNAACTSLIRSLRVY